MKLDDVSSISNFKKLDALTAVQHPLPHGQIFSSFGRHFSYRVIGACCRLFDREELPWPCCRLQWRSKEPSWRRVGKRFVPDLAVRNSPSYAVEILGQDYSREPLVLTLYSVKLPRPVQEWWYSKKITSLSSSPNDIEAFCCPNLAAIDPSMEQSIKP